jgi:hypothetical protein
MSEGDKPPTLIQELLDKFGSLITSAFGLVAALAWNEAIQSFFKEFFQEQESFLPKTVYAITVTILAVVFIFILARAISKAKERSSNLGF